MRRRLVQDERQIVGQGSPLAARAHCAARQSASPIHLSGNQIQPGTGVRLDHIRWSATGVPRPLHTLHRTVWRDTDFQRPPRRARGQFLQGVTNCHGNRLSRRRGRARPPYRKSMPALSWRDPTTREHAIHGCITAPPVRSRVGHMKATTIYAPRDVRLEDQPDPTIRKPTDAIVKVVAAGICGSDLWYYRGDTTIRDPFRIGHEFVGIVEEVGSD